MNSENNTFCRLDHIAIQTDDIASAIRFFEDVFGMRVYRTRGEGDNLSSVWLDGGIQLSSDPSACEPHVNGRFHHVGMLVPSVEAVKEKALRYGAKPYPGKGDHWFVLPNGLVFELKVFP